MAGAVALIDSKNVAGSVAPGVLVGGTAWAFSRPEMEGKLDYLFVDEAGQVSLANVVAMAPRRGTSSWSATRCSSPSPSRAPTPARAAVGLEYLLQDHHTIPPDLGIFLGKSYRMHEDVCRFISDAIYEDRLHSDASTAQHRVVRGKGGLAGDQEAGIVLVPVEHDGCEQAATRRWR